MKYENRKEIRFYVLIIMSFALLCMGFWVFPPGQIESSVLVASGCLMGMGGLAVGIDIQAIIREFRLLKRDMKEDNLTSLDNDSDSK